MQLKSYTDIEQSCKLAEILPIESADMYWRSLNLNGHISWSSHIKRLEPPLYDFEHYAPCWSLVALLDILPKQIGRYTKTLYWFDDAWHCEYVDEDSEGKYGVTADNCVDACYEMIINLKENNLI